MSIDRSKMVRTIHMLTELLCSRRLDEIVEATRGVRLSADEMEAALDHYGFVLCPMTEDEIDSRLGSDDHVFPIADARPAAWAVDVPLADVSHKNDLTLSLRLIDAPGSYYSVEVDDLHIL